MMKPVLVESLEKYRSLTEKYSRRDGVNNDYIQLEAERLVGQKRLSACEGINNLLLFVSGDAGTRVYLYLNDDSECFDFSESDYVVELLYRGAGNVPQRMVDYLTACGFSINVVREQYAGVEARMVDSRVNVDINVKPAESLDDVMKAINLFNRSFDRLSGDFLPESDCVRLFENQAILIAYGTGGEWCGALHHSITGRVATINHLAIDETYRGRHIANALIAAFRKENVAKGANRYSVWCQRQNEPAVRMYTRNGFCTTGKSTLSLIKQKKENING